MNKYVTTFLLIVASILTMTSCHPSPTHPSCTVVTEQLLDGSTQLLIFNNFGYVVHQEVVDKPFSTDSCDFCADFCTE
ncbi:MAG: hypothetical protein AAF798_15785 [Bacteroidota bacterium]